jgi:transposase
MAGMKPPMFVRSLTPDERKHLLSGLRSRKSFTVRRCQILLASSRGERVSEIARALGCATQTVRNVIRDFHTCGLPSVDEKSRRPKTVKPVLDEAKCERLKALLHSPPRQFGKPTSLWTLDLAAEVAFEQGLVSTPVSREVIRRAIRRLGVKWKRAKNWITSPDAQYALKKSNLKG